MKFWSGLHVAVSVCDCTDCCCAKAEITENTQDFFDSTMLPCVKRLLCLRKRAISLLPEILTSAMRGKKNPKTRTYDLGGREMLFLYLYSSKVKLKLVFFSWLLKKNDIIVIPKRKKLSSKVTHLLRVK